MTNGPIIVGLGGSLRDNSYSRAGLKAALELAAAQGATTHLLDLQSLNLPIFVPDRPLADYPAEHQAGLQELIEWSRRAQAMLWASPTYHGGMSGAFKNAVDFFEFLGSDEPSYLAGRSVGLIAVSDAVIFGAMNLSVRELRAWLAPTHVTLGGDDFAPDFTLHNERARRRLQRLVDELFSFVQR